MLVIVGNPAKLLSPPRTTLAEEAYHAIRELILRGKLPLGAVVSRRHLAKELGMSILPVAEAAQRLESDGFLESKPQVGTRVRIPTEQYARDRFVVREALESQAARLFCERATVEQKRELRLMAEQMDTLFGRLAANDSDAEFAFAVHQYHFQFHARIAEYSGCRALQELMQRANVLVFNWLYDRTATQPLQPVGAHRQLAEVLSGSDPEAADHAMRLHVRFGIEATVKAVSEWQCAEGPKWRRRPIAPAKRSLRGSLDKRGRGR
jgi:DNA-binding GntR family transcriptional regulator